MRQLLFTRGERRRVITLCSATLPAGAWVERPERVLGAFLQDLIATAPLSTLLGVKVFGWLLWLCPLVVLGRPRSFGGLAASERQLLLDALAAHRIYVVREMPLLFKALASFALLGLPESQARFGVEPRDITAPAWLDAAPGDAP
ncbi:MAG: hypothetical protein KF718_22770 [Polyangiaceae bacterium]|nr:hypothetical protein [Polyangiaceae bacterium]